MSVVSAKLDENAAILIDGSASLPANAPLAAAVPAVPGDEDQAPVEPPDPEFVAGFVVEAIEHLTAANGHLLALEAEPNNRELLNTVFRGFHSIKGLAGFLGFPRIGALAHEAEDLLDKARKGECLLVGAAMDVTFAAVDSLKDAVSKAGNGIYDGDAAWRAATRELTQRIRQVGHLAALAGCQLVDPAGSDAIVISRQTDGGKPLAAASAAGKQSGGQPAGQGINAKEVVRVDRDRLDKLIDMIGELVNAESAVHEVFVRSHGEVSPRTTQRLGQLNKVTRSLQELSRSLRIAPVRGVFQKMARLVRDLARKMDKQVDLKLVGDDTEVDKTVVDQIGDPLMHLLRNSLDHGIESDPQARLAAGKPARGLITLRALHLGDSIHIEIEDDGRGLDRDKILAKARERGLLAAGVDPSDAEVYQMIFEPGLTTADKVTEVSGRGVGLDVVRRNVEALHGAIAVHTTPGRGSTFSLHLPLRLAMIDGTVVRVR